MMKLNLSGIFMAMLCIPFTGVCGKLEVKIGGMRNTNGQIKVGVYKDKATFPKTGSELKGSDVFPVQKNTNVRTQTSVPHWKHNATVPVPNYAS